MTAWKIHTAIRTLSKFAKIRLKTNNTILSLYITYHSSRCWRKLFGKLQNSQHRRCKHHVHPKVSKHLEDYTESYLRRQYPRGHQNENLKSRVRISCRRDMAATSLTVPSSVKPCQAAEGASLLLLVSEQGMTAARLYIPSYCMHCYVTQRLMSMPGRFRRTNGEGCGNGDDVQGRCKYLFLVSTVLVIYYYPERRTIVNFVV